MSTILDLISVSPADERVGHELLSKNPRACAEDYRKTMREIPNLHYFLTKVRNTYPDASIPRMIWYRLWCAIKAEEEIGLNHTLECLRRMPNMDDRPIELKRNLDVKIITHCFKVLHGLCESAYLT